ncbi:MAG: FHA domain-containing serine/threonine-protein kinase [Planctomycetes bacterium]|nr:FHA domain-containing serine/threonine-protein kinase [Planctomycetota bacterium]
MSDDALIGRVVGDYKVVSRLGEGGMGMVYKGQHAALGQVVAIKSLHSSLMNNQSARERFVREAQALARLNHPNIISLLNFINNDQGCFIVMEFAEGEDIEHKLQRMGLIPPDQCIPWFIEILRALAFAHKQGIIHRDIKPSNIIVHPSGRAKLLDFGTAKLVDAKRLTQQGMTLGTIIYMSKEQLLGKPLDARSDLYSLGVTLYECVTGQLPFYDEVERNLVVKIAKTEPIAPSQHYPAIRPELEAIILKSMAKEPEQRFQTAEEFEAALTRLVSPAAMLATSTQGAPAPAGAAPAPVAHPTPGPVPVPAAPAPVAASAPGLAPAAPGAMLLSPLIIVGAFLGLLGVGIGVPAMLLAPAMWAKLVGAGVLLGLSLLGFALVIVGYLRWSAAVQAFAAGGAPLQPTASAPAVTPVGAGPPTSGQGPKCGTCGRALLPGMATCPFCVPSAPPPAPHVTAASAPAPVPVPAPPPPVPVSVSFAPGSTLNVNNPHAAQPMPVGVAAPAAPRPPAGTAVIQVIDGADKGRSYQVTRAAPFTIGRAPSCSAALNDPGVSGQHAQIAFEGVALVVQDTGSRNGVFVNNQKVQRHQLSAGDLIVIGSTRMLVSV